MAVLDPSPAASGRLLHRNNGKPQTQHPLVNMEDVVESRRPTVTQLGVRSGKGNGGGDGRDGDGKLVVETMMAVAEVVT